LSEQTIHLALLAGALVVAAWVFGIHGPTAKTPTHSAEEHSAGSPLSIIPPGSAFVLSLDVTRLRHANLGALLAERIRRLEPSAGDLVSLCGFDPLATLDQLALAVPSAGAVAGLHDDDFGVVATGHFSAAQITRCARAAVSERGGDPVDSELGGFHSVRDRTGPGGEVAARDGGPLIVSGGSYFRTLLDAAEGNAVHPEHQDPRDARHAELRRALGPGTIVATWLLTEGWFERVSGDTSAQLSPLRSLKALGARLDVSRALQASVLLDCADPASVTELEALLERLRSSLTALPLDPALRSAAQRITAQHEGPRLRLGLTLSEAELRALLDATLGAAEPKAGAARPAPSDAASGDALTIPAH
jgi:hypothetical protein